MSINRSGFLTIIGPPNAGKSTLLNKLLHFNLNIISSKPQTTRNNIAGILTDDKRGIQIIITDTPGILKKNKSLLDQKLQEAILKAVNSTDMILFLMSANDFFTSYKDIIFSIKEKKIILALNKIDLYPRDFTAEEKKLAPYFIKISALKETNLEDLLNIIDSLLTEKIQYYPDDIMSDRTERFFAKEYIREAILNNLKQEIPHQVFVDIIKMEDKKDIYAINGVIYTERENHKKIIIGKSGAMIKKIGIESRKRIEELVEKKVFLDLKVKYKNNWRNDPHFLKRLEYY